MLVRIGSYYLAGDPTKSEREHSSAMVQFAPVRIQQEITGLRWPFRRHFDRDNAGMECSFETTRRFLSFADVTTFMMAYHSASPPHAFQGTVIFRELLGGGNYQEYNLYHAVIEPPVMVPEGVTLHLRYNIRGGELKLGVTQATATGFDLTTEDDVPLTTEDGLHLAKEN